MRGSKEDQNETARLFASRGYVAVAINTRLEPDAPPDERPVGEGIDPSRILAASGNDGAEAVRWLQTHASGYDVSPSRIAIGGHSAGATTSLYVGYHQFPRPAEVATVVSLAAWNLPRITGAVDSPEFVIDHDDPPLFLAHGTEDIPASVAISDALFAAALDANVPVEFARIDGAGHAFDTTTISIDGENTVFENMLDFMFEHMELDELSSLRTKVDIFGAEEDWGYFQGTREPSEFPELGWTLLDFDDRGWARGVDGFGYSRNPDDRQISTLLPNMRDNYTTLYLRKKFNVTDVDAVDALLLTLDYDDAFVAYINGVEISRRHVGEEGSPEPFDSRAPQTRRDEGPKLYRFKIPDGLLNEAGENVLAIQGVNRSITNNDFVLSKIALMAELHQAGDGDGDGDVDMEDFLRLSNNFGQNGSWRDGDFNIDGAVNFADFLLLAAGIDHRGSSVVLPNLKADCNADNLVDILDANCTPGRRIKYFLEDYGTVPGDADGMGGVEFADFLILNSNFGLSPAAYTDGDFDMDGKVDFSDFLVLSGNYGQGGDFTAGATAAVPEPSSLLGLLLAALLLSNCRKSSRG